MEITKKVIEEAASELLEEEQPEDELDQGVKALRDLLLQRKDEVARDF